MLGSTNLPDTERYKGKEHVGKAEDGRRRLSQPLRKTRVAWSKLNCLKSSPQSVYCQTHRYNA